MNKLSIIEQAVNNWIAFNTIEKVRYKTKTISSQEHKINTAYCWFCQEVKLMRTITTTDKYVDPFNEVVDSNTYKECKCDYCNNDPDASQYTQRHISMRGY